MLFFQKIPQKGFTFFRFRKPDKKIQLSALCFEKKQTFCLKTLKGISSFQRILNFCMLLERNEAKNRMQPNFLYI